jgi:hypothetical protein
VTVGTRTQSTYFPLVADATGDESPLPIRSGFCWAMKYAKLKGGCCVYEIAENPRTGKLQAVNVKSSPERIHNALHCGMLSVLDLHPVGRSAGAIGPVPVLRDQSLQAHQAGVAE